MAGVIRRPRMTGFPPIFSGSTEILTKSALCSSVRTICVWYHKLGRLASTGAFMKVDGQCQCGAIRFEAEVDPAKVTICHCTDCQQFSGSAWRASVPAPAAAFAITQGEPTAYIKTAESGHRRLQAFCGV